MTPPPNRRYLIAPRDPPIAGPGPEGEGRGGKNPKRRPPGFFLLPAPPPSHWQRWPGGAQPHSLGKRGWGAQPSPRSHVSGWPH